MYDLVPVTCEECDKPFFKTNAMQEHMIRAHGIYTRVCLQCPNNDRLLAGHTIDPYKPVCIPDDQRAKACEAARNQTPDMVCNLCQKTGRSYTQLRTHLDKCHRIKSQVCLTRLYNDEIVCRIKKEQSAIPPAPHATHAPAEPDPATTVTETPMAPTAPAAAAANTIQSYQGNYGMQLRTAPNERVASVSRFGNAKIIKFVRPPEEPDAFNIEALQEEAYACGDFGDTTWDEVYERFEAQEQIPPNHSLYRNIRGETVVTSFEGGLRHIEFKCSHINNDDMIDAIVRGTLSAFSFFLRALMENTYNQFLYKRSNTFPFTDVHMKYGRWTIQHDSHIYPRVVESIAATMRKYMNGLVRTPQFTKIFNGTRDYESIDHFLYVLGIAHNTTELDPDYTHEMLNYFYKYVKELREIVADYSENKEMPWIAYPATGPVVN
jgi:hypothetical protein